MITCTLAGCSSFSIDKVKYYNEIVATIGDKNITRYELISSYNSFGQSYYTGQNEAEAMNSTLDILLTREALYQHVKSSGEFEPNEYEINEKVNDLFETLDSQLKSFIEKARKILKLDEPKTESTDSKTTYSIEDYKYSKRAELDDDNKIVYISNKEYSLDLILNKSDLLNFESSETLNKIINKYYEHLISSLEKTDNENAVALKDKAIELLVDRLNSNQYYLRDKNGKPLSKSTVDVVYRYVKDIWDSGIQSLYLEKFRVDYLESHAGEMNIMDLKTAYTTMVASSKYSYRTDSAYNTAMKNIGTDADTILYHRDTGVQFGYFIHTLIPFSTEGDDSQKKAIENIVIKDKESDAYKSEYLKIIQQTVGTDRTNDDSQIGLEDIIAEYNAIVSLPENTTDQYQIKLDKFIEFMFKYSTDTGTLSAGMPYVVGTYDKATEQYSQNSAMEQGFTDYAISLMTADDKATMKTVDFNNADSMCITSYGVHFLFYVGDVNCMDLPEVKTNPTSAYISKNNNPDDPNGLYNLYTRKINPLTDETYFDMLFDKVFPASSSEETYATDTGYTEYETSIANESKTKLGVVKYTTKIKSTKTRI